MVREAIILAAGEGSRLRMYISLPKPFAPVGRFRLLHFPLLSLRSVGVKRFIVVANRNAERLLTRLLNMFRGIDFHIVINNDIHRENGYSLYMGLEHLDGDVFFVSMSDHIYPPEVPQKLIKDMQPDIDILVAGDTDPQYIDIEEATRIYTINGRVIRIGKGLRKYNFVDAGLFLMRRTVYGLVQSIVREHEIVRISDIINHAVEQGYNVQVSDITGMPWIDVDTPKEMHKVMYGEASGIVDLITERVGEIS